MSSYITEEELKSEYPALDLSAYTGSTISTLIQKASSKVNDFVDYSFEVETVTDEIVKGFIDADGSLIFFPRKRPINSLTSINIVKGSSDVALTITSGGDNAYTIPKTADRVVFPIHDITLNSVDIIDFASLRNTDFYIKATYESGYATIPDIVKEATALYVLDTVGRSANLSGASKVSQGGISVEYGNRLFVDGRSELVLDAERILQGFVKVSGI